MFMVVQAQNVPHRNMKSLPGSFFDSRVPLFVLLLPLISEQIIIDLVTIKY